MFHAFGAVPWLLHCGTVVLLYSVLPVLQGASAVHWSSLGPHTRCHCRWLDEIQSSVCTKCAPFVVWHAQACWPLWCVLGGYEVAQQCSTSVSVPGLCWTRLAAEPNMRAWIPYVRYVCCKAPKLVLSVQLSGRCGSSTGRKRDQSSVLMAYSSVEMRQAYIRDDVLVLVAVTIRAFVAVLIPSCWLG